MTAIVVFVVMLSLGIHAGETVRGGPRRMSLRKCMIAVLFVGTALGADWFIWQSRSPYKNVGIFAVELFFGIVVFSVGYWLGLRGFVHDPPEAPWPK